MAQVRDWLALAMGNGRSVATSYDETVGRKLSAQQRAAVGRGVEVVERYGGVLLADSVGLGKTRVAVEMAQRLVRRMRRDGTSGDAVVFVVPARLRQNWRRAIGAAGWQVGRDAEVISHHAMSRAPLSGRPSAIVVDEAHRFRNPAAKRSRHLAAATARSPPILATATPVCTRRRDLLTLLGFFLNDAAVRAMVGMGLEAAFVAEEAGEFDIVEILEEVVIRREVADFSTGGRPGVTFEVVEYRAGDDEAWLWKNLEPHLRALSLRATGKFWPRGLLINNLLRMWESGPEALWRSLDELIHFHERWLEAAAAGRSVERPEFRELFSGVHRDQQVFSFLYRPTKQLLPDRRRQRCVEADLSSLQQLLNRVDTVCRSGSGMVDAIATLLNEHDQQRFLIFSSFRASAEAIFNHLVSAAGPSLRAGLITGEEARATGLGKTTDRDVLRRFLADEKILGRHRALRILVATDCLSEGVNLQRCTRLVLADLPYSPVRLEQRVGRIARPGSAVDNVTVYLPRPRSWTDSLGMRRKLGRRLEMARQFGAGHGLAEAVAGEEGGDADGDDEPGPLAAMTLEKRLCSRVQKAASTDGTPEFARLEGGGGGDLWLRIRIDAEFIRHVWLWVRADGGAPKVRLSEQLPGLARLADDRREIVPWEPHGELWATARQWLDGRRSRLEAARLAPPLLGAADEKAVEVCVMAALRL